MKKMILCLILACIFPVSVLAGEFYDNFEDIEKSEVVWEVIQREWVFQDGYYWAPGEAGLAECPMAMLDIEVESGMIIEAQCSDMGDGHWQNFAVIYAYEDEDLAWSAGAGVGNNQWRMFRFTPELSKGGAWGDDFVAGVPVKKAFVMGEWYNIRIEINGPDIKLFGSSEPESDDLDEESACTLPNEPEGRIGISSAGASPMYNEFRVTADSLKLITSKDKLATTWAKVKVMH